MRATLSIGDQTTDLYVGDTIGRLIGADLFIDDPRISELHAYISLRAGQLVLLPLRGSLRMYGAQVHSVSLRPGQRIALADGVELVVEAVHGSQEVIALRVDGTTLPLTGATLGLRTDGTATSFSDPEAVVQVWRSGEVWSVRGAGLPSQPLDEAGVQCGGLHIALSRVDVEGLAVPQTCATGWGERLSLTARYDSVVIHREERPPVRLTGRAAAALTLLAEVNGPVAWYAAASELWPQIEDRSALRRRWDRCLLSIRTKCRAAGLRSDLVTTSGGQAELMLHPGDEVRVEG